MAIDMILPAIGSMVVLLQTPTLFATWITLKEVEFTYEDNDRREDTE